MKKNKILFIANRLGGGGAERVLVLIANELKRTGYDVNILIFTDHANTYENECNVIKLSCKNKLKQILQLRRVFKDCNPDVIIAFEYFINMKTVLAAIGLKVKVIISERNDPNKLNNKWLLKWIRNILYAHCDVLVCQTNDAKKCFSSKIQNKAVIIINPIRENLPTWNQQSYKHKIINFCRLEKQKNLPLLIDSFNEVLKVHPDYELLIYGEGKENGYLQNYIKEKGLAKNIKIEPFSPNVHQIARECHIFVSSSDYEGLSNSMLEAMAIGMPVICTDCPIGGARMVIRNKENGMLVPVGDKYALVNAVNWVIDNPEECRKLSIAAANIRKELAVEEIVAKWKILI